MTNIYLDFIPLFGSDDADLVVMLADSSISRIRHLSVAMIRDSCPLLYYAFEEGVHCRYQANIEATSLEVVTSFLRYLYHGNYLAPGEEAQQCSLLLHAELCKMAEDFQVSDLQVSAYFNFMQTTEISCSFPMPPFGLFEAIQFIYKHFASQQSCQQQLLVEALVNYCVSSFKYHSLGENPEFRQIVYETPAFHKHLCETSMARNFNDDGAAEIICLPVRDPIPRVHNCLVDNDCGDFHFDPFCDSEDMDQNPHGHKMKAMENLLRKSSVEHGTTALAYRPRGVQGLSTFSESGLSSDEEGYTIVHCPKLVINSPLTGNHSTDDSPSSPELIPGTPSEDEWAFEVLSVDDYTPLLANPASNTPYNPVSYPDTLMDTSDDDWSCI